MPVSRKLKSSPNDKPKSQSFFARLASLGVLALVGVLFGAALGECLLRLTGFVEPHLITYDSARGWALMPGGGGWQGEEGGTYVAINRYGFRGPNRSLKKPKGVFRVAVLGDSFTEAQQLPYEQTFSGVIERELAQCPVIAGRKVEVLNLGVDSYGTAQELLTLREQALAFSPDVVVVAVFTGNDIRNNSVDLEGDKCRPFFDERDGILVPVGPFAESPTFKLSCMARFLSRYSQVLNLMGEAKSKLRETQRRLAAPRKSAAIKPTPANSRPASAASEPAVGPAAASTVVSARSEKPPQLAGGPAASSSPPERQRHEAGLNDMIYLAPANPTWRRAWSVTEAELAAIARDARARGARVLVVTLSVAIQVYLDPRVPAAYARELGVADLFAPERRLAAAAVRDGYPELNLAPLMAAYAQSHHAFLHGFANTSLGWGHWNALGHRVGGELIAQRICTDLSSAPDLPQSRLLGTPGPADRWASSAVSRGKLSLLRRACNACGLRRLGVVQAYLLVPGAALVLSASFRPTHRPVGRRATLAACYS